MHVRHVKVLVRPGLFFDSAVCVTSPSAAPPREFFWGGGGPEKFLGPVEFRGVNSTGQRLQQEGQRPLGGVVAKATACEDISYYNEKMLLQQTSLLA